MKNSPRVFGPKPIEDGRGRFIQEGTLMKKLLKEFKLEIVLAVTLFGFLFVFFVLTGCYSAPVINPVNTEQTQKDATKSAKDLNQAATDPGTPAQIRPTLAEASRALSSCSASLAVTTQKQNDCAKAETVCRDNYEGLSKEYKAYRDKYNWWASFTGALSGWKWGFLIGVVLTAIGFIFGPAIVRLLLSRVP